MFTTKTPFLKAKAFYRKSLTAQINIHVKKEERLKIFDQNDVYLSTKKISKNNSMADEMRADNEARQDWNRTADPVLVVGVSENKGLEIKREEIQNKSKYFICEHGWLLGLFRTIVQKALVFSKAGREKRKKQKWRPPSRKPAISKTEFPAWYRNRATGIYGRLQ